MQYPDRSEVEKIVLWERRAASNGECLFFKVEELIGIGEKECFSLKQKVTSHVVTAVLVSCCSSLKETHFPFATRVFSLLQKKIKKLEGVITAVVSSAKSLENRGKRQSGLSITAKLETGG